MPAGRPPTPTALKVLTGNPGHRPLPVAEPRPAAEVPRLPAWLDPEAKREWRRIAPKLARLGLLTEIDGAALAGYCQSFARWQQAERAITEHGLTVEVWAIDRATGQRLAAVRARPEVAIAQRERQQMRAFLTLFGLDPSSRSRVSATPAATTDPFDDLIARAGSGMRER